VTVIIIVIAIPFTEYLLYTLDHLLRAPSL